MKSNVNCGNVLFVFTVKMNFDPKSRFREILRELPKEGRPINLIKKDSDRSQSKPDTQRQRGKTTDSLFLNYHPISKSVKNCFYLYL